jgi:zinc D-Ala-D-Ala carboxypeptidase
MTKTNLKYFTLDEFDCPTLPNSGVNMDSVFLQKLEAAREIAGIPFRINSGYRTQEHHNAIYKKLGKEPTKSAHLIGKAADIHCTDSRSRFTIISALLDAGFNRIGIASTFIHCDTAEKGKTQNVIWTY